LPEAAAQGAAAAQPGSPGIAGQGIAGQGAARTLPDPAETLRQARQRFPQVDERVLRGAVGQNLHPPDAVAQAVTQAFAHPLREATPLMIGRAEDSRVALMPTQGVSGPDKQAAIQRYVNEGRDLYKQIMNNTYEGRPNKHDVAKLMWFLQAMGSAKATESSGDGLGAPAMFKEGAFMLEDPDGRLQDFLTQANSYGRASSHMRDYQAMGNDYSTRGVDLHNVETPHRRGTLMFARIPQENEAAAGGPAGTPRRMLFLKMEPYGCPGLTPRNGPPRNPERPPSVWKGIKHFFVNSWNTICHGLTFMRSLGQRMGLVATDGQDNRERIPGEIRRNYTALLNKANTAPLAGVKAALEERHPLSDSGGIKQMLPNLNRALEAYAALPEEMQAAHAELGNLMRGMRDILATHGDHPEMRIGNEIIMTREELMPDEFQAQSIRAFSQQSGPVSAQGELSPRSAEINLIGAQYILDNIHNSNRQNNFIADAERANYTLGGTVFVRDAPGAEAAVWNMVTNGRPIDNPNALTDAERHVGLALMSFCNQSLCNTIVNPLMTTAVSTIGTVPPVDPDGGYGIERLNMPDDQGNTVYRVSYAAADIHCNATLSTSQERPIRLDPAQSSIRINVDLDIHVRQDGSMFPSYPWPPSYSYTLAALPRQ
jgi:hypothetical protein